MPAHTGRLVLTTHDPFLIPAVPPLVEALTEAGFLGVPLVDRDGAYAVGEGFLQLLTFAGCSVQVELAPTGDAPFCHARLFGPSGRPVFLSGRNTRPPRCRGCRSPLQDWWRRLSNGVEAPPTPIACPACGEACPPWDYDWKEKAGFGRLFVQIEEIFPGEATPTPLLMDLLEGSTGCKWRHFYIQD